MLYSTVFLRGPRDINTKASPFLDLAALGLLHTDNFVAVQQAQRIKGLFNLHPHVSVYTKKKLSIIE